MKHFKLPALAVLLLMCVIPATAESRSGVLTFPADGPQLRAIFSAAQELLKRDCTITKSVVDQQLETSDTVYDTISAVSSAAAKSTWTWALVFAAERDGRVTVTISHTAEGHRPPRSLVEFARNLAAALHATPTGVKLELNGTQKPLSAWRRP
jgi:hypothetical protein